MAEQAPNQIRISVVVSTFNRPERLIECVRSILNQTLEPVEVLIIHDGPGRVTHEALELEFSEQLDKQVIRFEETDRWVGRPAPARNLGIKLAHGDWIAFCDDDDLWFPIKLEVQGMAIDPHPDAVAVFSDYSPIFVNESKVAREKSFEAGELTVRVADRRARYLLLNDILRLGGLCHSSAVVRRDAISDRLFPEGRFVRAFEDWCAWLHLSLMGGRLVLLDQALLWYLSDNSTSIRRNRVVHNLRLVFYTVRALAGRGRFLSIALFLYFRVRAGLRRFSGHATDQSR